MSELVRFLDRPANMMNAADEIEEDSGLFRRKVWRQIFKEYLSIRKKYNGSDSYRTFETLFKEKDFSYK